MSTAPRPTNGYALKSYREHFAHDGVAFVATLTLNGKKIADVSNDGWGGSNFYVFPNRAEEVAFLEFAREWNATSEYAGIEDGDALVEHLILAVTMNRKKTIPFHLASDKFEQTGQFGMFQGVTDRAEVVRRLSSPQFSGQDPHVWVREVGDFVPLAQVTI